MDFTTIPAADVMERKVVTLLSTMNLEEARDVFVRNRISGAPVVDDNDILVGVLSQTDLIRIGLGAEADETDDHDFLLGVSAWGGSSGDETVIERLRRRQVAQVMDQNTYSARGGDSVAYIAREMRRHGVHRIVITTEEGKVVGIVTPFDLLKLLEAQS